MTTKAFLRDPCEGVVKKLHSLCLRAAKSGLREKIIFVVAHLDELERAELMSLRAKVPLVAYVISPPDERGRWWK